MRGSRKTGLTLIELIVAMTVTVLVAGATGAMLRTFSSARDRIDRHMSVQQESRAAMDAVVSALRSASRSPGPERVLEGISGGQGDLPSDRIRFFTVSDRPVRPGMAESDFRECEFFLVSGNASHAPSLFRRLDPTRNDPPDGGGVVERIADHVVGLEFRYHDGTNWRDDWPLKMDSWPTAISIRMMVVAAGRPGETNVAGGLSVLSRMVSFPYRVQIPPSGPDAAEKPDAAKGSPGNNEGQPSPEAKQ